MLFLVAGPEWRNWQTRRTQNPVAARPCGFDPLLRDHFSPPRTFFILSNFGLTMLDGELRLAPRLPSDLLACTKGEKSETKGIESV
jgi:hypothetical protein